MDLWVYLFIGYYSADFNNHPTSFLMIQLLELHDRSNFEIFCFSLANRKDDEMRKRVSNSCDKFLDVSLKSDEEIARISRDLNLLQFVIFFSLSILTTLFILFMNNSFMF